METGEKKMILQEGPKNEATYKSRPLVDNILPDESEERKPNERESEQK